MNITAKFLVSDRFPRWSELELDTDIHESWVDGQFVAWDSALDQLSECEECCVDGDMRRDCVEISAMLEGGPVITYICDECGYEWYKFDGDDAASCPKCGCESFDTED